jgi:excinuclease UvrABC helicase subunit UvrB
MSNFDELHNDFLKGQNKKPVDDKTKMVLDIIKKIHEVGENEFLADRNDLDIKLGKPDKVEYYNEGDMFFTKKTWITPIGDIVKTTMSEDDTLIPAPSEKTLEEKLDEAVSEENYEKAAAIRDEIKKQKRKIKNNNIK